MSDSARIVFAGTPEFAAQHLQALLDSQHQVVAVYTQPDRPAGRGQKLVASPVKQLALAHDIPVLQPQNLRTEEAQPTLAAFKADLMVVVAYGLILPQVILDTPRLGCINSHASLLPRWRGAAPIQRAIEAGDAETGVTVMQMEAGLDTGPMLLKVATPIADNDTGGRLHDRLAAMGPPAVLETIAQLLAGTAQPTIQQDEQATYAHKLSKGCAFIDWQQPAQVIERAVRAFHPWPISHTLLGETSIKVHAAQVVEQQGTPGSILQVSREGLLVACGQDALLITQMQLPNAKALAFADIYNGRAELFTLGQVLGA
ncbi:MAG: methionyl-tRNA formyltransferase [Thiopseudomonas sp.]|nr:methionyl-tRNA formyltransferase [Thiopseudomonas sp.]MCK9464390.1 methionyl-tRNA formyltransferase [Thiopseudomonas sp.]